MRKSKKHVVIIGGGFGGLAAAKELGNIDGLSVTLIDRRNYHLFQPLLYQVAMAGLSPAEIAVPIRNILSKFKNIRVVLGNVETIDLESRSVHADVDCLEYDYLVVACGAKHSYFGNENWEEHAPGLKTVEQATEIRRRVLMAFERAETEKDSAVQKSLLTFVVVGGGPTGVELAGALGEISRYTLTKDFKQIDPNRTRIVLVEAGKRILQSFSAELSEKAEGCLHKLGVELRKNSRVTGVSKEGINIGAELLPARTVLWAAGVKPSSLNETLNAETDIVGRIKVLPDLSLKNHNEVFVIGDQACFLTETGDPLPGVAPVAIQQGVHAAKNIVKDLSSQGRSNFKYKDRGQLATIGRKTAVLEKGQLKLHGKLAWLMWLVVHIYYLIGFKNRLLVFVHWAWQYFTYTRGARLIVHKEWRSYLRKINS